MANIEYKLSKKPAHNFIDLTGTRFGRLTVIEVSERGKPVKWMCLCDCGNQKSIAGYRLKNRQTQSCGCLHSETTKKLFTTHGATVARKISKEYRAWFLAKDRCYNPNSPSYENYGGRGIGMCDEWRSDFVKFYDYIGKAPSPDHSIDRINNNGNYEPGNVRWATKTEQAQNRRMRKNTGLTIDGETKTVLEWESHFDFTKGFLQNRLSKGWCVNCSVTIPIAKKGVNRRTYGCPHRSTKNVPQ